MLSNAVKNVIKCCAECVSAVQNYMHCRILHKLFAESVPNIILIVEFAVSYILSVEQD